MRKTTIPEIKEADVLAVLRTNDHFFSRNPHAIRVITFKKYEYDDDVEHPIDFEVTVRCRHQNYISLVRDLYKTDQYGFVREANSEVDSTEMVPHIQTILRRLRDGGYIYIGKQKCQYHTDHNIEYDDDDHEIYTDPRRFFSESEKELLETAVTLTVKGHNRFSFLKETFLSEPIGALSLVVSILAFIVSILLKNDL